MSHTLDENPQQLHETAKQEQVIHAFTLLRTRYEQTASFGCHLGRSDLLDAVSGWKQPYQKSIVQSNHIQHSSTVASDPAGLQNQPGILLPGHLINNHDYYQQGA